MINRVELSQLEMILVKLLTGQVGAWGMWARLKHRSQYTNRGQRQIKFALNGFCELRFFEIVLGVRSSFQMQL